MLKNGKKMVKDRKKTDRKKVLEKMNRKNSKMVDRKKTKNLK